MSLHPSLASLGKTKKQRTVLKRIEKIKYLMEKELWQEGDSVFGLPKIKIVRIKFKKEKVKEAPVSEEAVPSEGAEDVSAASGKSTSEKPAADSKKDKPR